MERIKVTEDNLLLFKNKANHIVTASGEYMYLPYWFKIEDDHVIPIVFDNLPEDLKETIRKERITNNKVCFLCDGRGARKFLDCTPPIYEPCPVCNREEFLKQKS